MSKNRVKSSFPAKKVLVAGESTLYSRDNNTSRRVPSTKQQDEFASDNSILDDDSGGDDEDGSLEEYGSSKGEESDDSDVDKPRVAQWVGEDDLEVLESEEQEDKGEGPSKPKFGGVEDVLSSLSFGSLLKARKVLDQSREDESNSEETNSEDEVDSESDDNTTLQARQEANTYKRTVNVSQEENKRKKAEKRSNKHAPIEMSSKRQVTRRRQVVEVKKCNFRDPRFMAAPGRHDIEAFHDRYSFLSDLHKTELDTLKDNLNRAKKLLRSSPRHLREEREQEVERLERALKRTESLVNRDRREAIERRALGEVKKKEREQRKEGKGEWYMKKSAKKELLLKARHDALAETGGRLAVKKAIEKRRKKVNQKEKKRRPSFLGRERDEGPSKRRKV